MLLWGLLVDELSLWASMVSAVWYEIYLYDAFGLVHYSLTEKAIEMKFPNLLSYNISEVPKVEYRTASVCICRDLFVVSFELIDETW